MFPRKDEKIKQLEKRIEELESQMENEIRDMKRRTKEQMHDLDESFKILKNVLKKVQEEKGELEKDRNFLIEKHKDLIRQIPADRGKLKRDIREKLLMPMQRRVKENAELIKQAAVEGLEQEEEKREEDFIKKLKTAVADNKDDNEETKTPIDELFELVMNEGIVKISDAAKKFGVTEAQLEEWARILENHELIEIHYPPVGKPELRKKQQ